jgi:HK97 gp10 family phage protein
LTDDGGLSRFQNRMRAIPAAAREAVKPALLKSANEVADMQRRLAPEDTGELRESIHVTAPGQSTPPYSQPGGSRVAGELEAIVTAGDHTVRYAHLVEHGTTKAPAQPFFWPGFRLTRKRAATRIKGAVSRAVKKNWGGK